jgi:hypothetical protein
VRFGNGNPDAFGGQRSIQLSYGCLRPDERAPCCEGT